MAFTASPPNLSAKSPKITGVLRLSSPPMNTFPQKTGLDYILFRRGGVFTVSHPWTILFLVSPHRRCRPAVHETATRTLSRRKPGPIGPPTERWKGGPRLSAGAAHLSSRALEPSCFVLVPQRRCRPAGDETGAKSMVVWRCAAAQRSV